MTEKDPMHFEISVQLHAGDNEKASEIKAF